MKDRILLVILLFAAWECLFAGTGNYASDVRVSVACLDRCDIEKVQHRYFEGETICLDYNEWAQVQLLWYGHDVDPILPIAAFIQNITFEITLNNVQYLYTKELPEVLGYGKEPLLTNYTFCIAEVVKEANDPGNNQHPNIDRKNIHDVSIKMEVNWRTSGKRGNEYWNNVVGVFHEENSILQEDQRTDTFTIDVSHFGWVILADVSKLSAATDGKLVEAFKSFLTDSVLKGDTGWVYSVSSEHKEGTSLSMTTVPIIRHNGREIFSRNMVIDACAITASFEDLKDYNIGYGTCLGLFGKKGVVKLGVCWFKNERPTFIIGITGCDLLSFIKQSQLL